MKRFEPYAMYQTKLTPLAKNLRSVMTPAEQAFWQMVRKKSIEGCLFLRQKPVLSYIADFYCAKLLLIIEIDGFSHEEKDEMDQARTMELQEYGYTLIRYTNNQVLNESARVKNHLIKVIQCLKKSHSMDSLSSVYR